VAFFYSMRTALLPFLFIFNTDLILYNVSPAAAVPIFILATAAMLIFTAGMQGYFLARSRIWESIALVLIAFTLFRPGFWMDYAVSPYREMAPNQLVQAMGDAEPGSEIRVMADGLDDVGEPISLTLMIAVPEGATGEERREAFGVDLIEDEGKVLVDGATFDSPAEKAGFDFDQVIKQVLVPASQPPKELFYIPALLLLGLIVWLQRKRQEPETAAVPSSTEAGA
jgi:hypothetical protein